MVLFMLEVTGYGLWFYGTIKENLIIEPLKNCKKYRQLIFRLKKLKKYKRILTNY